MGYFCVDDRFFGHPKVATAPAAAIGLWVQAGCWCARWSIEGRLPHGLPRLLGSSPRIAQQLVDAGLWELDGTGWRFALDPAYDLWRIDRGPYRQKIPQDVRSFVLDRDGHACLHCGATEELTMDHVYPWSKGGSDTPDNLQTLCRSCNSSKGVTV